MFFKQWLHSSIVRFALIAVVLCSTTLLGERSTGQAQASTALSAPNTSAEQVFVQCSVKNITVNYVYNHVSLYSLDCSPSTGAISYFIVPADSKKANQVLSIALTAQATGRKVVMVYDPDDTTGIPTDIVGSTRKLLTLGLDQ